MCRRALLVLLVLLVASLAGCKKDETREYLTIEGSRIERGEGVSLIGGGGAQVGHSVMIVGTLTNAHPSKTAFNLHIEVKLFRRAGDDKPERTYSDEFSVKGLEKVGPGQKAEFRHYVKTSIAGYEHCEVRPVSAQFQ